MTTKEISQQTKRLYSTDTLQVLKSLEVIKKEGDARFLPALLNIYETENNPKITVPLEALLFNIKEEQAVPVRAIAQ